ncbi:MAG: RagB/SusD family nutrient uptake outer membrane protein [Prevotella sp.]|jgi:hypothetical protein
MKSFIRILCSFLLITTFTACDLQEDQKATADKNIVFSSTNGLKTYTNSFYNMLPDFGNAFCLDDVCDYGARLHLGVYETGAYTVNTATSWDWSALRNINYFIQNNTSSNVSQTVRDNYTGIAKFFRAYFYFDKLVTYGEVPWIDSPLTSNDERLYGKRDSRDIIISHIIDDLDSAYQCITEANITTNSNTINKWTAMMFKSRVCLFEASWRKYHAGTDYVKGCKISSEELYKQAADAAKIVMDQGPYSIYTGTAYANGRGSYRELFINENTVTQEVMLAVSLDAALQMGDQNWWYNSSTYGEHLSMTHTFANTYLNRDGSFFSDKNADGTYKTFQEETSNRDLRLNQTIRAYDYTRKDPNGNYTLTAANFTGLTLTGYQFTKYVMDDVAYDDGRKNTNDIPIFRYAEVLLNYAEAKAELGTLSDEDWSKTIGVLRRRAGITGGDLDNKPVKVDPYLQQYYYPHISDPVILEIRRERACELCLEGLRMMDLKRWACGSIWKTAPWSGMYIPALDTPLDVNGDEVPDVYFTKNANYSGPYSGICVKLEELLTVHSLEDDPNHGYRLYYDEKSHTWNDNMYLYPIPQQVIIENENITQNPGW